MRPGRHPSAGLAGQLLVAHPGLVDPNFRRTVVFMSAHDEEGALGVVMNRPLGKTLGDLSADFAVTTLADVPVFGGGPVQVEKLILAAWRMHPEGDGFKLFFGIEPEKAMALAGEDDGYLQLRAFAGYSGWTAGQLDNELKHHTWVVTEMPFDLFDLPEDRRLWREVLGRQGDDWRLLAGEPDDPAAN